MEEKDFLVSLVREMSRIFVKKTHGQENIWNSKPLDWDEAKAGKWKNPTATPKDSKKVLDIKFKYLQQHLEADMLPKSLKQKINFFTRGNKDNALCYMQGDKWLKDVEAINKNIVDKLLSKSTSDSAMMKLEEDIKSECQSIIDKIDEKNTLQKKQKNESINKYNLKRVSSECSGSASNNAAKKQRFLPILPKQPMTVEPNTIPTFTTLPHNLTLSTQPSPDPKTYQVNFTTTQIQNLTPDMFSPAELSVKSDNIVSDSLIHLVSGDIIDQPDNYHSDTSNTSVTTFDENLSEFKNLFKTYLDSNANIYNIDADSPTKSLVSYDVNSPNNPISNININNTGTTSEIDVINLPTISTFYEDLSTSTTILSPTSIDSHKSSSSYSSSITSPEESILGANFESNTFKDSLNDADFLD